MGNIVSYFKSFVVPAVPVDPAVPAVPAVLSMNDFWNLHATTTEGTLLYHLQWRNTQQELKEKQVCKNCNTRIDSTRVISLNGPKYEGIISGRHAYYCSSCHFYEIPKDENSSSLHVILIKLYDEKKFPKLNDQTFYTDGKDPQSVSVIEGIILHHKDGTLTITNNKQ